MRKLVLMLFMLMTATMMNAKDIRTLVVTTNPQMHCPRCENRVKEGFKDVKGIKSDAISSLDKRDDINEYGQFKKAQEQQPNITLTDVYIEVPFYEKEEAKELGAKWDRSVKHWYVPQGVDLNLFEKWKKADIAANRINAEAEKIKRNSLNRMAANKAKETVNKTKTRTKTR